MSSRLPLPAGSPREAAIPSATKQRDPADLRHSGGGSHQQEGCGVPARSSLPPRSRERSIPRRRCPKHRGPAPSPNQPRARLRNGQQCARPGTISRRKSRQPRVRTPQFPSPEDSTFPPGVSAADSAPRASGAQPKQQSVGGNPETRHAVRLVNNWPCQPSFDRQMIVTTMADELRVVSCFLYVRAGGVLSPAVCTGTVKQ